MKRNFAYLFVSLLMLHANNCFSITRACPTVCPSNTGAAQFCSLTVRDNANLGSLCVTGNAQIAGDLTVCGVINGSFAAYGFFYDDDFATTSLIDPAKIPFTNTGISFNLTHNNATDIEINFDGVYRITALVEPSNALNVNSVLEIQVNDTLVDGSAFVIPGQLSDIEYSTQAIVTVVAGDVITVVLTPDSPQETTLSGISSIIVEKIA